MSLGTYSDKPTERSFIETCSLYNAVKLISPVDIFTVVRMQELPYTWLLEQIRDITFNRSYSTDYLTIETGVSRAVISTLIGLLMLSEKNSQQVSVPLLCDCMCCVSPLQPHALLQRVKSCISDEEEEKLLQITSLHSLNAFLLPIKTVGVQVIPSVH